MRVPHFIKHRWVYSQPRRMRVTTVSRFDNSARTDETEKMTHRECAVCHIHQHFDASLGRFVTTGRET